MRPILTSFDGVVVSNLVLAASAGSQLVNKHLGSLAQNEDLSRYIL